MLGVDPRAGWYPPRVSEAEGSRTKARYVLVRRCLEATIRDRPGLWRERRYIRARAVGRSLSVALKRAVKVKKLLGAVEECHCSPRTISFQSRPAPRGVIIVTSRLAARHVLAHVWAARWPASSASAKRGRTSMPGSTGNAAKPPAERAAHT